MNAETVLRIKPALTEYLHEFDGCFGRVSRRHLDTYVEGQLGPLERKSVEPIADAAGPPPRTLQEFLSLLRWDGLAARDRLQQRVARRHAHPHAVGIPDDVVYRSKWQIGLGQIRRALVNGVRFAWLAFDEFYGGNGLFLDSVASLPRSKSLSEKPRVRHICNQSQLLGFGWYVASAPGRRTATTLLRQTQKRVCLNKYA